jgi:hypothetical protein
VAIVAAGAATAAAGTAPSNGVASKSPSAIVAAARSAIDGVSTVHVDGSGVSNGESLGLDLWLVAGKGGRGSVSEGGLGFQLVVIGKTLYFNASTAFWKKFANSAAAALFAGKWLKAAASGQYASLASFTNIRSLFTQLLSPKGTLSKGALSTVLGQQVVPVTDRTDGGTLYVATTGPAYPVEVVGPAGKRDVVVINDIGKPVSLTAPPGAIDISSLTGT